MGLSEWTWVKRQPAFKDLLELSLMVAVNAGFYCSYTLQLFVCTLLIIGHMLAIPKVPFINGKYRKALILRGLYMYISRIKV